MQGRFVKLHEKITEWEWYKDANTMRVFLHLLIKANWKPARYKGHDVEIGQVVTGYKALSKDLGISERAIRTSFEHLKTTGELTTKVTSKFSIVTLCNYSKYNGAKTEIDNQPDNQPDSQLTGNRQASDKQVTPLLEVQKKQTDYNNQNSLFPDVAKATPAAVASSIVKPAKRKTAPKETDPLIEAKRATWEAYKAAYRIRYGEEPVSNAKQYSLIKQIVSRIPADEAPDVVSFFVRSHNSHYIGKGHSLQSFVFDCEKLRTEWITGRQTTHTQAHQQDNTYTRVSNIVTAALRSENEKRISTGSDDHGGNLQLESFSGSMESGN